MGQIGDIGMGLANLVGRVTERRIEPFELNDPTAMTPTPTLILFVAIFWTLPASLAVIAYRRNESFLKDLKTSVHHSTERALNAIRVEQAWLRLDVEPK